MILTKQDTEEEDDKRLSIPSSHLWDTGESMEDGEWEFVGNGSDPSSSIFFGDQFADEHMFFNDDVFCEGAEPDKEDEEDEEEDEEGAWRRCEIALVILVVSALVKLVHTIYENYIVYSSGKYLIT